MAEIVRLKTMLVKEGNISCLFYPWIDWMDAEALARLPLCQDTVTIRKLSTRTKQLSKYLKLQLT